MDAGTNITPPHFQSHLVELVTRFRGALEHVIADGKAPFNIECFPDGCCGITTELLGDYLNSLDIGEFKYVRAKKSTSSHAWLEVYGLIVDITSDQFPGRPRIYVDKPDAWYNEWRVEAKEIAKHDSLASFYLDERNFLLQVIEVMEESTLPTQADRDVPAV